MEGAFSLRPAISEDLPAIVEIERRAHVAPWTLEHFTSELEKPYSQTLILTDDETDSKIAGYIVIWILNGECHILNIVVDLPFRGLGLAKQMLIRIRALAERGGAKKINLEVRRSNQAAVQLYNSFHFVITHVRKGFYSNGEDAYQMTLELEGSEIRF